MSDWFDDNDLADWGRDRITLRGDDQRARALLPVQHCATHGDYQPRSILDGECAACLADTIRAGRYHHYRNR